MAERNLQTERAAVSVIKRHYDKVLQRWSGLQMFFWCEKTFGTEHNRCHVIMVLVIFAVKMQPQSNESSIMS